MNRPAPGTHYLYPGNLFAHKDPHVVTTVLGSCVSVCLWDKELMIGGINHYMLPLWNGEGLATPKYGNIAINKLYEKMIALGSNHSNIKAKVFGGAEVLAVTHAVLNVGERNAILAVDMLRDMRIPVIGKDLGGKLGRKLIFESDSGKVYLKKLTRQIDDFRP